MWQAVHKVDSSGYANVEIVDDANAHGYTRVDLTPLEGDRLIKSLRKAIDAAEAHNRNKAMKRWP